MSTTLVDMFFFFIDFTIFEIIHNTNNNESMIVINNKNIGEINAILKKLISSEIFPA